MLHAGNVIATETSISPGPTSWNVQTTVHGIIDINVTGLGHGPRGSIAGPVASACFYMLQS